MTKMDAKSSHRRSCANSKALPVQLVWRRLDVPYSGSGSPGSAVLQLETARKQPSELPRCGPWCRHASLCTQLAKPPFAVPACYATVPQRPSGPIGKRARDQRGALRYATRPASAVQHGGAIIRCVGAGARARSSSSSAQGARLITKL